MKKNKWWRKSNDTLSKMLSPKMDGPDGFGDRYSQHVDTLENFEYAPVLPSPQWLLHPLQLLPLGLHVWLSPSLLGVPEWWPAFLHKWEPQSLSGGRILSSPTSLPWLHPLALPLHFLLSLYSPGSSSFITQVSDFSLGLPSLTGKRPGTGQGFPAWFRINRFCPLSLLSCYS